MGTDIALISRAAMQSGVIVRAAADGRVKAMRDGMHDIPRQSPNAPPLNGQDCGNGVVIAHGDGWESQYCHMAKGSVQVSPGQTVTRGGALGLVGLSGNTDFPHLHLSLRKDGVAIDPFDPKASLGCATPPASSLWTTPIPYQAGGLISAGITSEIPFWPALTEGLPQPKPSRSSAALVVWAMYYANRPGDQITITLRGPQGILLTQAVTLEKQQARGFRAIGKSLRAPTWPRGRYSADITLTRNAQPLDQRAITITIP
jgi:hypothetical protein